MTQEPCEEAHPCGYLAPRLASSPGDDAHVATKAGPVVRAGAIVVATNTPVNDRLRIHTKQAPYLTYAVGPPTTLDGARAYVWEIGAGPDDLPIAPVPTWLLERLRHRTDGEARPVDEWAALVRDGADAGARNDAVARLAGYLLRRRPAPRVVLELVRAWNASRCRPALEDDEITRTVESIAARELRRREAGR